VKFWWQRRTRGWDDSELWNLDHSLAKLILPRLRAFERMTRCYPGDSTSEQWHSDLRDMIVAFEFIASDDYWEWSTEKDAQIQRGLDLFAKWYRSLWD
jgi:hypothetical protein